MMAWSVEFHDDFAPEFRALDHAVQIAALKGANALAVEGPGLGRPWVDTLKGSAHGNMKELRLTVDKVEWRIAFAFDPRRKALMLAAAAKGGKKERLVYKALIATADRRFTAHLEVHRSEKTKEGS
jgi:hypothetical protein